MSIKQKIVKFNNFFVSAYKDLRGGGIKKGTMCYLCSPKSENVRKAEGFLPFWQLLGCSG